MSSSSDARFAGRRASLLARIMYEQVIGFGGVSERIKSISCITYHWPRSLRESPDDPRYNVSMFLSPRPLAMPPLHASTLERGRCRILGHGTLTSTLELVCARLKAKTRANEQLKSAKPDLDSSAVN